MPRKRKVYDPAARRKRRRREKEREAAEAVAAAAEAELDIPDVEDIPMAEPEVQPQVEEFVQPGERYPFNEERYVPKDNELGRRGEWRVACNEVYGGDNDLVFKYQGHEGVVEEGSGEMDGTAQFREMMENVDGLRAEGLQNFNVKEMINKCNVGYRFVVPCVGVTIGELVGKYRQQSGGRMGGLVGCYLRGTLRKVKLAMSKYQTGNIRGVAFTDTTTMYLPLWRVMDVGEGAIPVGQATLQARLEAIRAYMATQGEVTYNQWLTGSTLDSWVIMGDVEICRRNRMYRGLSNGQRNFVDTMIDTPPGGGWAPNRLRTGGFSELLIETESVCIQIEGRNHCVIIPGGVRNCVDECIIFALYLASDLRLGCVEKYVDEIKQEMISEYVEERIVKARGRMGTQRRKTPGDYKKEFERLVKNGYSGRILQRVKDFWKRKLNKNVRVLYEGEEMSYDVLRWRMNEVGKEIPIGDGGDEVHIFRVGLDGELYRRRRAMSCGGEVRSRGEMVGSEGEDRSMGMLLHAVLVWPPLDIARLYSSSSYREVVRETINAVTKEYMRAERNKSVGWVYDFGVNLYDDFRRGVDYQNERYEKGGDQNLFFKSDICDEGEVERVGEGVRKMWYLKEVLVVAYDIETVEMKVEAIRAGRVDLSFFPGIEEVDLDVYQPSGRQIPYSVQWVPVNLSDEGELRERKRELDLRCGGESSIVDYGWLGASDSELKNTWYETSKNKKVKGEWIMMDDVRVLYGKNEKLGECVHDFIEEIGEYAVKYKYFGGVVCYAHNGSGFDAYIIEAYNSRYTIAKRLKTGRGILSLTIDYPYFVRSEDNGGQVMRKVLKLTFVDTRVFLSFSLSKICGDFSVPKEWQKLDFPITRVNWKNCYRMDVKELTEPYAINDVRSLAFVVKQINRMLCFFKKEVIMEGMEEWIEKPDGLQGFDCLGEGGEGVFSPVNMNSRKPPITQFVTYMSVVKKMLDLYFTRRRISKPMSVDVASLRYWIDRAQIGGRVTPYGKVYVSGMWKEFFEAYMMGDVEGRKAVARKAIESGDCMVVLDVTSLYPTAMARCPMPTGRMRAVEGGAECRRLVDLVGCVRCEGERKLCSLHNTENEGCELRPVAILIVENLRPSEKCKKGLRNTSARKMMKGSDGLVYSLEDEDEIIKRVGGEGVEGWGDDLIDQDGVWGTDEKKGCGRYQAFTNIDLYWMEKQGFVFDCFVSGLVWESTGVYSGLMTDCFKMRAAAKKANNQCLQLTLKLMLNGAFGVHSQKVIREKEIIVNMPEELREAHYSDPAVEKFLAKNHMSVLDARYKVVDLVHLPTGQAIVCGKMSKDIGEATGGGYSPNHVGCAVLAWSRHIVNLVMYGIGEKECTYTDTDSLCVSSRVYDELVEMGGIIDEGGKELGTYKNDHADYFKNPIETKPRVLFSAIGAKKVKMHIVVNSEGEVKVANTYKGFMSMPVDPETGQKYSYEKMAYEESKALLEILYDGTPEQRQGTRWSRTSEEGVRIEKDVLFSPDSSTYMAFCKGFTRGEAVEGYPNSFVSYVVPHGSTYNSEQVITPVYDKDKKTYSLVAAGWGEILKKGLRGVSKIDMICFMKKYYGDAWNEYYSPKAGGSDMEEYKAITDFFNSLEEEQ